MEANERECQRLNTDTKVQEERSMHKKIQVLLALMLVGAMVLVACQPAADEVAPPPESGGFKVGYSAAGLIDAVQIAWSEGLVEVIEDAGGEVIIVDSQNEIAKQIADIEDLLAQDISYLVTNPVDEAGIVPAIEAANAAGVPVITIDRAAGGGDVAVHVTFDNYLAGYDAGVYIAEMNDETGKVAQLEGMAGTSVARERAEGFQDAIAEYPNMEIVFEQPADWDTAKALTVTEDMLAAHPDVVGIWAHADAMIMGAVEALKAAGVNAQVFTVGMGMYAGGPEAIAAGDLNASWELYPAELGKVAGEAVVTMFEGGDVDPIFNTPMTFVTFDNIAEFVTPVEAGPFLVGYSAAGLIDAVQIAWSEGLVEVIEDAGGEVIIVDSQNEIAKQIADIEDLLAQDISYLVTNPVDEAGIVPAIEAANAAGVPVITIDRAAGGGDVAVHVTFDNYLAGYDAGVYIAEMNDETGKVAQLEGMAGTSVARERAEGFQDAIAEYPNMEIVFEQPADWDTAKALTVTEDMLAAHPDVVGIWAHADAMIMGAVEALKAAGVNDQVFTVGMGMYAGGPEAIAAGDLNASWELYPAALGKVAGEAVVTMFEGGDVDPIFNTPMTFVTFDNIAEFLP